MKRRVFPILGLALIPLLALVLAACGGGGAAPTATPTPRPTATPTPTMAPPGGAVTEIEVQMTENPYLFVPDHLELEAGKTYRFNLRAGAEFHTFTIESLGINVNVLPGQDATVEVTVDTPGEHELICLPHQTQGMVGEVHVE